MKTSRVVLTTVAVAFACFVAPVVAAINAQSGDKTTTVTLTIEGMT